MNEIRKKETEERMGNVGKKELEKKKNKRRKE